MGRRKSRHVPTESMSYDDQRREAIIRDALAFIFRSSVKIETPSGAQQDMNAFIDPYAHDLRAMTMPQDAEEITAGRTRGISDPPGFSDAETHASCAGYLERSPEQKQTQTQTQTHTQTHRFEGHDCISADKNTAPIFSRFIVQVQRDLEPGQVSQAFDKNLKSYFCRMLRAQTEHDTKNIYIKVGGKNPVSEEALEIKLRSSEIGPFTMKVQGIAYPGHPEQKFLLWKDIRWSQTLKFFRRHQMRDDELLRIPNNARRRTCQPRFSSTR